jgi:thioesterase domain-containing protein
LKGIARDDSFFDLGGHSLAALRLFAILAREWQVRVPMAALIQAPTPRLLAEFLQQGTAEPPHAASHEPVVITIRAARSAGTTEPHSEIRMLQVREAYWTAMEAYHPPRLACRVVLFRTEVADDKYDIPADYGWTELVDSLEIVDVAGRHLTMFEPRYAAALAKKIAARM